MSSIAGIDEAGRGAVIGPLVVCISICDRRDERTLNRLGKKDSKQLSPAQREERLPELKKICEFHALELTAEELSSKMETMSLNDIEAQAMASLASKAKDADVMIDLPDRYFRIFQERMTRYGAKHFEAEHKADEKYPIVAAASICAKIIRDKRIEQIKKEHGVDFGSGYPSDPKTRKFLLDKERMREMKTFVRQRWKTLETVKQKKLHEFRSE
ncbi:MAG: ribonuclease HII [Candidatus Bilamarchaeaceae archaeon]